MDQQAMVSKLMDDANRALIASEGDKADALSNLYIQSINNLIEDLQKINSKYYDKEEPTFSDWKRMGLDSESFNLINKQMGVFGGGLKQASVDQFARDITNFWKESYLRTAYVIDSAVPPNVDIGFQMPPDVFLYDYLNTPMKGKAFSEELGFISDEMAYHIHGQLVLSMWSGDSTAEMAKRIRDYVGIDEDQKLVTRPRASAQIYRANTIARTEMARAGNMAANYLFDQNQDILEDKVWTAKWSGIGVCDECLMRDGLTPDEIDELGDDLDTEPPGHPNCRCRWAPKVKDWNDILGDLGNGMKSDIELPDGPVKPAPYEDWANDYVSPSGFVQIHAEVS